jgi:hypothetical protein
MGANDDTVKVDKRVDEILDKVSGLPGYVFELSADFGSGRNFSIRGNFGVGAKLEDMNTEMDKLVRVVDRQLCKAVIPNIEEDIFKHEKMLEKAKRDYATLDGRRQGHKSIPQTEISQLENQKATIAELEGLVKRKKDLLVKTKKDAE